MKVNLTPTNIYSSIQYKDEENKIVASQIDGKWYPTIEDAMFDAGFVNISAMTEFIDNLDVYAEELQFLGYHQLGTVFVNNAGSEFISEIRILDDGEFNLEAFTTKENGSAWEYQYRTWDFEDLKRYAKHLIEKYNVEIFASIILTSHEKSQYVIEAAMSSRDLAKNLVRVKSSNIWSYGINIKDRKDKQGDVLIQFKDAKGGPGDVYLYHDVSVNVWRKWLSATSKGSFFWRFIRDKYSYRKLTGDKKGKLKNAINN